jgi:hypothetical protein
MTGEEIGGDICDCYYVGTQFNSLAAAGDLHTGRATVISAVAGGRLAVRFIHDLLRPKSLRFLIASSIESILKVF